MNKQYNTSEHLVYLCRYHVIFCPKYRRRIFVDGIDVRTKQIFFNTAKVHDFQILEMEVMPDHVHMYVSIPPKISVSKVIGRIKGKSALMIFDRHPEYREKYNRHFWARGYYCETVGNVNEETIKKYIGEQYERDRMEGDSGK